MPNPQYTVYRGHRLLKCALYQKAVLHLIKSLYVTTKKKYVSIFVTTDYGLTSIFFPSPLSSPHRGREAFSDGIDSQGPTRKLYSAVPGKHYVVTQSYQPQAEGEIPLYKNDKVKGKHPGRSMLYPRAK